MDNQATKHIKTFLTKKIASCNWLSPITNTSMLLSSQSKPSRMPSLQHWLQQTVTFHSNCGIDWHHKFKIPLISCVHCILICLNQHMKYWTGNMIGTDSLCPCLGARLLSMKIAANHGHWEKLTLGISGHPKTIIDVIIVTSWKQELTKYQDLQNCSSTCWHDSPSTPQGTDRWIGRHYHNSKWHSQREKIVTITWPKNRRFVTPAPCPRGTKGGKWDAIAHTGGRTKGDIWHTNHHHTTSKKLTEDNEDQEPNCQTGVENNQTSPLASHQKQHARHHTCPQYHPRYEHSSPPPCSGNQHKCTHNNVRCHQVHTIALYCNKQSMSLLYKNMHLTVQSTPHAHSWNTPKCQYTLNTLWAQLNIQ